MRYNVRYRLKGLTSDMTGSKYPSQEYELLKEIEEYCHFTPSNRFPIGLGDDAVIRQSNHNETLVFTADTMVEGVHFSFDYMSAEEVGFKSMVTNISDCAAMGTLPDSALIQLIFPTHDTEGINKTIKEIYSGFYRACKQWDFPIVGGDLSKGPCWMIAISLTGRAHKSESLLKRIGIKEGDSIWTTGIAGMSAAGLELLTRCGRSNVPHQYNSFVSAHVNPQAQVEIGRNLAADPSVHAAIDCSDGIAKECHTLAFENSIGIILDPPSPIIETFATLDKSWEEYFLYGGEDYELLFAASQDFAVANYPGKQLYKIGTATETIEGVVLVVDGKERYVEKGAWDHLSQTIT